MEIDKILGTNKVGANALSGMGDNDKTGIGLMGGGNSSECEHNWKIFNDTKLKGSGEVSFYCTKCKALSKRKVEYKEE